MSKQIMDIQGLNAWNALLLVILVVWALSRKACGRRWDMPPIASKLVVAYVAVVLIAASRMLANLDSFPPRLGATFTAMASTYVVNSLKWMIPGVLLYDLVRTRRKLLLATMATLGIALCYALLMWRQSSEWLTESASWEWRRFQAAAYTGLHPNEVAFALTWSLWGTVCVVVAVRRWPYRLVGLMVVFLIGLGLAKTSCRGAYLTLPCVGIVLGLLRFRVVLVMVVAVVLVGLSLNAVTSRLMYGRTDDVTGSVEDVKAAQTSGRLTYIWPIAMDLFAQSPIIGHGRLGLARGPGAALSYERFGWQWGHAHNAYLEMLVDSGIIGLAIALGVFVPLLLVSMRLARCRRDRLVEMVGGVGVAALVTYLVMGIASQSFFPKPELTGLWCVAGLVLRTHVSFAPGRHCSVSQGVRQSGHLV